MEEGEGTESIDQPQITTHVPSKRSEKIQKLLSTFEQEPPINPGEEIRLARKRVQDELLLTRQQLLSEHEKYEKTIQENQYLLKRLEEYEQQFTTERKKHEKLQSFHEELETKHTELLGTLDSLKQEKEQYLKEKKEMLEKHASQSTLVEHDPPLSPNSISAGKSSSPIANPLREINRLQDVNRDSLRLISEYDQMNKEQSAELQEVKNQLVGMIDMAEKLERDLNAERSAHQITRNALQAARRSSADESSVVQKQSKLYPPSSSDEFLSPSMFGSSISPRRESREKRNADIGRETKKRRRIFMRKPFSKSQTKIDTDFIHSADGPDSSPSFVSVKSSNQKREIEAGSASHGYGSSSDPQPVAMSGEQMRKELEVLVVLGEKLQEELQSEKRNHTKSKQLIAEQQKLIEDLQREHNHRFLGVLKRKTNSASNSVHKSRISSKSDVLDVESMKPVDDSEENYETDPEDVPAVLDPSDLSATLREVIGFTDHLIHSYEATSQFDKRASSSQIPVSIA